MERKVTQGADADLTEAAIRRATSENTTLNDKLSIWLDDNAERQWQAAKAMGAIRELGGKVRTGGRKFTREEMNER